jgi:uncharacterized pyridoxamine 5'-phosphate oxidase family protein
MPNLNLQENIFHFIHDKRLAVMATVHPDNSLEAAVIQFAVTENLEIIFNTFSTYRKYVNLQKNPAVALVFGGEEKITVQYEGVARECFGNEREKVKTLFLQKYPKAGKWDNYPQTRWFVVTPKWIRYSDLRNDIWINREVNMS